MKLKLCEYEILLLSLNLVISFILTLRKADFLLEHVLFNCELATEHSSVAKSLLIYNMEVADVCSLRALRLSLPPCNTDTYPLQVYSTL